MRLTPRKEEIEVVKDILEDPTFENADQMAKALIKEVADMLAMRDWFALVHTWTDGTRGLNFAPFGNEAEVKAFATKLSIGGTGRLVKLYGPGPFIANIDGRKGWKGYCQHPECGHAPFTHSAVGNSKGQCHVPTCPCDKWIAEPPKKRK
ncbi:hypothetical protein AB0D08_00615 [Kitasatospora sp. NPDC048540]|uniref:hypothetical protein n=1 Tax=Kitasatospora sp. NPDC048540 TaxID=3155634 RepID=UPI0033E28D0F